jgi:hypothetical protein
MDSLEKHCIDAEPMLDKKTGSQKNGFSAHPVLWICSRFSTVGVVLHAKRHVAIAQDATDASCSSCRQNRSRAESAFVLSQQHAGLFFLRRDAFPSLVNLDRKKG